MLTQEEKEVKWEEFHDLAGADVSFGQVLD